MTDGVDTITTTIVARKIRAGAEKKYEDWLRRVIKVGSGFPGHRGVDIVRPSPGTCGLHLLLVRFDSQADMQRWENSRERQGFLRELADLTTGETLRDNATGLESWFSVPGAPMPPNRHRMTLLITVVVFLLVLLIQGVAGPLLGRLSLIPRVALLSILQVGLLSYAIMPWLSRWLSRWLHPQEKV